MPSRTWPERRRGAACSSVCLSVSLSFTRLPPSTTDLVNPTLVPRVLVCLVPGWLWRSHPGSMRVWGLPAAMVGKTHGAPEPWKVCSLDLFSGGVLYPPREAGPHSSSTVQCSESGSSQFFSVFDLPVCSHCLLEEGHGACPEGPGRCESAVSQLCLSSGSMFFPSHPPALSPNRDRQGWCWVPCPLTGDPEWSRGR